MAVSVCEFCAALQAEGEAAPWKIPESRFENSCVSCEWLGGGASLGFRHTNGVRFFSEEVEVAAEDSRLPGWCRRWHSAVPLVPLAVPCDLQDPDHAGCLFQRCSKLENGGDLKVRWQACTDSSIVSSCSLILVANRC